MVTSLALSVMVGARRMENPKPEIRNPKADMPTARLKQLVKAAKNACPQSLVRRMNRRRERRQGKRQCVEFDENKWVSHALEHVRD